MGGSQTAEILLDDPEVVETSADDGESTVMLSGTMFAEGLNANAWGLTEEGAKSIASSLEGADLTAGHPPVVGYGFTRSIHEDRGKPIGSVEKANVTTVGSAKMASVGGHYTAEYEASVQSGRYAEDFRNGLMIGGDYGVSIGITAEDEDAVCSVCESVFAECKHRRGEEVNGQMAGPLYTGGEGDHLAVVYVPAWDEADADVSASQQTQGAMMARSADEFFGQPHSELSGSAAQEQGAEPVSFDEGDLVEYVGMPMMFGEVVTIDTERNVAMVERHMEQDGDLVTTGHTYTAGYDDLVPYGAQSDMASQSEPDSETQTQFKLEL